MKIALLFPFTEISPLSIKSISSLLSLNVFSSTIIAKPSSSILLFEYVINLAERFIPSPITVNSFLDFEPTAPEKRCDEVIPILVLNSFSRFSFISSAHLKAIFSLFSNE